VHDDLPLAIQRLMPRLGACARERWLGVDEPRWELYFAVVYLACALIAETASFSVLATAALAAIVPWYLLVGRPVMRLNYEHWAVSQRNWRPPVYLAGLIVLFGFVQWHNPNAWFLAFAVSPQCFMVTTQRRGMVFVVLLNVTAAVLLTLRIRGPAAVASAIGIAIFAIAFSWVFSRWTLHVVERSLERQALIEQLEATRAELAAVNHNAGVLAERQRLAGEIHDTLAQGFTSIITLIQAASAGLDAAAIPAEPARKHMDMALATARENLAEARALVTALGPAHLACGSLGDAVCRVAETAGAELGIDCRAEISGTIRPLPTAAEVVLLRVCQEALANIRKHAEARSASVRLCYADEAVRLVVTDDGRGFDAAAANGGYGLSGIRHRVSQAGGTVAIRSSPGAGTTVLAEVPA